MLRVYDIQQWIDFDDRYRQRSRKKLNQGGTDPLVQPYDRAEPLPLRVKHEAAVACAWYALHVSGDHEERKTITSECLEILGLPEPVDYGKRFINSYGKPLERR